jgi:hypothetical protein
LFGTPFEVICPAQPEIRVAAVSRNSGGKLQCAADFYSVFRGSHSAIVFAIRYLLSAILPMPAIAQSVSWWCFVPQKLTPKEFVRAVADAGYSAVDLVPSEYFSLVMDHGLKIAAIAGHEYLTVGLNRRDQHARIKKEIEAKLADLVRYGIPNLICFAGNRDGREDSEGITSQRRDWPN